MSRTVTAFFDSRSDAEAARLRLSQSNIDADRVRIIDQSHTTGSSGGTQQGEGFWASIKNAFMPEEDSHAYEEGIRRGGYLLCAQVEEDQADSAIALLDDDSSVDFDRRQEEWRSEGWSGFGGRTDTGAPSGAGMGGSGLGSDYQRGTFAGSDTGRDFESTTAGTGSRSGSRTVEEEHIPIVEEELVVGKREVARGGARVRSYVREKPVREQVNLREEHVSVERRPVEGKLGAADLGNDAFSERTIEMTETAEEAVVAKKARVTEELVVRKTADEHVETIDDTVRRTEVDIDEGAAGREDRSAFGSFGKDSSTSRGSDSGLGGTDRETERTGYSGDKSGY